eukprot:TRINITY_DN67923_c2_g1_i1.p1 TRINITY_DN67923_c2_g1~~TRINITY_DN67923_c2_g1_i1.p1  ORF type:complete len:250 (+),score=-7.32 TRINITY_DN67923_c2_g1_i1:45-794(+)
MPEKNLKSAHAMRTNKTATFASHLYRLLMTGSHLLVVVGYVVYVLYGVFLWEWNMSSGGGVQSNETVRGLTLCAFGVIYWLRLQLMMYFMLPRQIALDELVAVGFIFQPLIHGSFGYCSQHFAHTGLTNFATSDVGFLVALVMYIVGSVFNTLSELQRTWYKAKPCNKGKLYTGGLYAWSRHPNYFGDVVLFSGWALLTGSWVNFWVPVVMALGFVFHHIPDMEIYMRGRYKEWPEYERKTKSLIPFLF